MWRSVFGVYQHMIVKRRCEMRNRADTHTQTRTDFQWLTDVQQSLNIICAFMCVCVVAVRFKPFCECVNAMIAGN